MNTEIMPANVAVTTDPMRQTAKIYDLLACSPLFAWYGLSLVQQAPVLVHDIAALVLTRSGPLAVIDVLSKLAVFLFAAVLIFMFVVRRPATAKVHGIYPRAAALLGAYIGIGLLLLPPRSIGWELKMVSALLILGGVGIALYGLLWLGRSISIAPEARKLVVGGPYSIVRHPLYVGEQAALVGVVLQYLSPMALILMALQLGFQIRRMGYEEEILSKTFPEYGEYKKRTARLIPGIY